MGERRVCTDVLCLLLLAAASSAVFAIFIWGLHTGDLDAIFYDSDYIGNRCGVGNFSSRKKAFYPRLGLDLESQPTTVASGRWYDLELYALCVDQCPAVFSIADPVFIRDYGYDRRSELTLSVKQHGPVPAAHTHTHARVWARCSAVMPTPRLAARKGHSRRVDRVDADHRRPQSLHTAHRVDTEPDEALRLPRLHSERCRCAWRALRHVLWSGRMARLQQLGSELGAVRGGEYRVPERRPRGLYRAARRADGGCDRRAVACDDANRGGRHRVPCAAFRGLHDPAALVCADYNSDAARRNCAAAAASDDRVLCTLWRFNRRLHREQHPGQREQQTELERAVCQRHGAAGVGRDTLVHRRGRREEPGPLHGCLLGARRRHASGDHILPSEPAEGAPRGGDREGVGQGVWSAAGPLLLALPDHLDPGRLVRVGALHGRADLDGTALRARVAAQLDAERGGRRLGVSISRGGQHRRGQRQRRASAGERRNLRRARVGGQLRSARQVGGRH
eukprot:2636534-Prymnesium_polylepis.1